MILGPISLLDCVVFVLFLIPQLLYQAGVWPTSLLVLKVLPFLLFKLPFQLFYERWIVRKAARSPFVQHATIFQDLVIRCVRYAFAHIPARVARVFFSKWVVYPFFRFRLLKHGFRASPISCEELNKSGVRGLWITTHPGLRPDVVIYYCHGGGFSLGSPYFYLEFLMAWLTLLEERGCRNPAIFALDYTLVPDAIWPKQFEETRAGYKFLIDYVGDASAVCVSGDSAGGTLVLSHLLHNGPIHEKSAVRSTDKPALAVLISPWTHLVSPLNQNTRSDYLDKDSLHLYAQQYTGGLSVHGSVVSPGMFRGAWENASPLKGYYILFGSEEVFAPGVHQLVEKMRKSGAVVRLYEEVAGIHAWPVVDLFLGTSREERLKGMNILANAVVANLGPKDGLAKAISELQPTKTANQFLKHWVPT